MRQLKVLENSNLKGNERVRGTLEKEGPSLYDQNYYLNQKIIKTLQIEVKGKLVHYFGTTDKYNQPDGLGMFIYSDGSIYEGFVSNGIKVKYGRHIYDTGDLYQGAYQEDLAHGMGVYRHVKGSEYVGEWVRDLQEGQGKEKWPDGSLYEGEYQQGRKHGKGNFRWPNGSDYSGYFIAGNFQG